MDSLSDHNPSPPTDRNPSPPTNHIPSPPTDCYPSPPTNHIPSPPTDCYPSPSTDYSLSSPPTDYNPSPSTDRNPSPPPEILQQLEEVTPDRVGDTVFSRHWVIQVLVNVVESVREEKSENEVTSSSPKSESQEEEITSTTSDDIQEIDEKLEDDVCALWDMSVNKDVADFLQEYKAADILLDVIIKTKCPRLVEIIIGILGNIASFDEICEELSNNDHVINTVLPLVGCSDAPTVIQVLRLMRTCVINDNTCPRWLAALRKDPMFMGNIRFILENSLNDELLKGSLQLLYFVLDDDVISCRIWAEENYMKSLQSVATQLASRKDGTAIDELWLLLNVLCQDELCIASLGRHIDIFYYVFVAYINLFGEYDHNVLPCSERTAPVSAAFTTFATIAKEIKDCFPKLDDDTFQQTIKRMLKATRETLTKLRENRVQNSNGEQLEQNSNGEQSEQNSNGEQSEQNSNEEQLLLENDFHDSKDKENSLIILRQTIIAFCEFTTPSLIENRSNTEEKG